MTEEVKMTLRRVLATLEGITVSGKANLDYMLGAMLTLEKLINMPDMPDREEKTDE